MPLLSKSSSRNPAGGGGHSRQAILTLLASCLCSSWIIGHVNADLLDTPNLQWSFSLEGSDDNGSALGGRSLRRGNAIIPWRGGDKLFVTADDGSLHILDTSGETPTTSSVFEPTPVARTFTECRSGVVVIGDEVNHKAADAPSAYLVYAVIDTPWASSTTEFNGPDVVGNNNSDRITSRVIAVNLDGTLRWSVSMDGTIVGTPVVGSDDRFVYISRTESSGKGFLSVILIDADGEKAELTASLAPVDRDAPFGPPALQRRIDQGNANPSIDGDQVVVAENWDGGYTEQGSIYTMVRSPEFEDTGGRSEVSFQLLLINRSSWTFSSVMAPLLVGNSLFIGGTSATVAGWTANRDLTSILQDNEEDIDPLWLSQLDNNRFNSSQPFLTTPEISSDGSLLYLAGVSQDFYCLQSDNGRESWSASVDSAIISPPLIFNSLNGQSVIYLVEAMDGRMRQFNAENGEENWQFNCQDVTGASSCQNSVEADFSLSPSGNFIYYGDIYGQITAWGVGAFETEAPTAAPSPAPTDLPSSAPSLTRPLTGEPTMTSTTSSTEAPTDKKTPADAPDSSGIFDDTDSALGTDGSTGVGDSGDDEIGTGVIAGTAVAGLLLVVLVAIFVGRSLLKPRKKKKKSSVQPKVSGGDVENDFDGSGDDGENAAADEADDVTVTSENGDAVEVMARPPLDQTPTANVGLKKKRKAKARSPPTPSTLASIEEVEDEEVPPGPNPRVNQSEKVSAADEIVKEENDNSEGNVHHSDDSESLPPPTKSQRDETSILEEEKKEEESHSAGSPDTLSPQPSFGVDAQETTSHSGLTCSKRSLLGSVASTLSRTPSAHTTRSASLPASPRLAHSPKLSDRLSPGVMSTDSSLYTDDNRTLTSTDKMSPLSTGVFGGSSDQGSLPDDEAAARATAMLPNLDNSSSARSDNLLQVPGAQYFAKNSTLRPKFKPAAANTLPKVKSARTKRNLTGFSGSYLNTAEDSSGSDDEGRIRSDATSTAAEAKKVPTFKRRTKKEEDPPAASNFIENTWNSFLRDLAAAEQQFFSPTHAQKSAVLRYSKSDSFDDGTARLRDEDDKTVRI